MTVKHYSPLLKITVVAIIFYILNKLFFLLPDYKAAYTSYHYSLEVVYLFFWICSLVVLGAVLKVNAKSPDNTGFAYMGSTLVQMGLCYIMLRPILANDSAGFEKINFFIIFMLQQKIQ